MGTSHHKWTQEETKYFTDNFSNKTCQEISDHLKIAIHVVKSKRKQLGLVKSKDDLKKIYSRPNPGQFRSGQLPANTLSDNVITTRMDKNGNVYKWIRVALANWEMLHVHVWKTAGRKIPFGHVVAFADKDNTNCAIENLVLLTRSENLIRNRQRYLEIKHTERQLKAAAQIAEKAFKTTQRLIHKEQKRESEIFRRQQAKKEKAELKLQNRINKAAVAAKPSKKKAVINLKVIEQQTADLLLKRRSV